MGVRENIITDRYNKNYSVLDINRDLAKYGLSPLGPRETALIETNRWGTNPIERVRKDATEFTQGINTLLSAGKDYAGQLIVNPNATIARTSRDIGNYMNRRGVSGAIEDVYNMMVEPYGLDANSIRRKGLGQALIEAPANAWAHPGYTALDLATLGKGKVPKKAIGNFLEAKNAPKVLQDFIPSEKVSKVNDIVNTAQSATAAADRNMAIAIASATREGKGDLVQAVKNLEVGGNKGVWQGDKATIDLTKKLADISDTYDKQLLELGVEVGKNKNVTVAQYMMEALNPNRTNSIHTADIAAYLNGTTKRVKGYTGKLDDLARLRAEAEALYDSGVIKPLSHRATFKADPNATGLVSDTDRALGSLADRQYGWATPEELAPTLFKAYEGAAREIRDANVGRLSLDETARTIGRKVSPTAIKELELAPGETIFSPSAFNEVLAKDFNKGNFTSVNRRIGEVVERGLSRDLWKKYADDLYVVDKRHLRPIVNRFTPSSSGLRWLNNIWKTAQLITPKYFLENRLGNAILNMVEGVGLDDYLDAMKGGKYNAIRPERLKTDTSYFGVLGDEFRGTPGGQALRQASNMIKEGVLEGDIRKFGKGTYDVFTAPVLAFESQFEGLDRYANFIRQAKRLSKETGESVESIIKRSSNDNVLYGKLMKNVNRSLGDYIGRNWAIDPQLYEGLSFMFPFFKYPTQGLRTLLYQASNNPLRYHSMVTLPQRMGRNMWLNQVYQHPELENERGGIIDYNASQGMPYLALKSTDVHPLGAGAGLLSNALGNWSNIGMSPLLDLARIATFQDRYGNTASAPWYINSPSGRTTFIRNADGSPSREIMREPTLGDRLSYAGAELANLYIPAVKAWNSYLGPGLAAASPIAERFGSSPMRWYPRYNTSMMGQVTDTRMPRALQPIISGRTDYPGIKGAEALSKILGTNTVKVYPKQSRKMSITDFKSTRKNYNKKQRNRLRKEGR